MQIRGLAGEHGIIPAQQFLDAVWNQLGTRALWQVPTLCWINASDAMLVALCLTGAALSVALMCGLCPGLCALLLWVLYLSLCWIATPFTNFQWDALLLETALVATLLLPWRRRPRWERWRPVQQAGLWLLWWLLFRLMEESGGVKLASGDPTWHSLTALEYHFETQPLPLWTAWYANQIPGTILFLVTFVMFLIELLAPLLILAPRRWRHGGAWALIALQAGILATGNYAFFNVLTIALCLLLFDDTAWPAPPGPRGSKTPAPKADPWTPLARWLIGPVMAFVFLVTVQPFFFRWAGAYLDGVRGTRWPAPFYTLTAAVQPLLSFNGYGLFAVMTTSRHEISVEGSDDGEHWREYAFPWKPGDLNGRPGLVAPHQPRLDWQMWFAALGNAHGTTSGSCVSSCACWKALPRSSACCAPIPSPATRPATSAPSFTTITSPASTTATPAGGSASPSASLLPAPHPARWPARHGRSRLSQFECLLPAGRNRRKSLEENRPVSFVLQKTKRPVS